MTFDNGLKAFQRRLARIAPSVRKAASEALVAAAEDINTTQRRIVEVEDGTLKASIRNEPGRSDLERVVLAGGDATTRPSIAGRPYDYAAAVEFGTRSVGARPFFWTGYRIEKKRLKRRIKAATNRAAKKAFENGQ